MATEVDTTQGGLGWDHYPVTLTAEDEENLSLREAASHELEDMLAIRTAIFFPGQPNRKVDKKERVLDYEIDTIHGLALIQADIVGVAMAYPNTGIADQDSTYPFKIEGLGVIPTYRRNGIGSGIVRFLELRAREQGATSIVLDSDNRYVSFYKKLGYVLDPTFALDDNATPMRKDLMTEVIYAE